MTVLETMNKTDILILEIILLFCIVFFSLQYLIRFLNTQSNKSKGREVLRLLGAKDFGKIEVRIYRGDTRSFLNSTLFYSEDILIFTQSENYNFEELNFTLPLVVRNNEVKDFIIRSDEYILRIGTSGFGKEIQIYTEKENDLLNIIINNFKNQSYNSSLRNQH
jgi:hypothetical protein